MKEADDVLEYVYHNQHKHLTTEQIADAIGLTLGEVEEALDLLEQNYLVNIGVKADATDYQDITITEEGIRTVETDLLFTERLTTEHETNPLAEQWDMARKA